MLRLRPYKQCDAEFISDWVRDEKVFRRWGGDRFGDYPITPEIIDRKYTRDNGDCAEADNFWPWTAVDDGNRPVGHFIMRYTGGDPKQLRFGWVLVDDSLRGKGIGKQMLSLGLKMAFEILDAERVTIGVFEHNEAAHRCYRSIGFRETGIVQGDPWNIVEMNILKQEYSRNRCPDKAPKGTSEV